MPPQPSEQARWFSEEVHAHDASLKRYLRRSFPHFDPWMRYSTRLFSNRVGASLQLNVVNVTEDGRLQAISAWPDGTPNAYRIVDPRKFILTATFDL